MSIDTTKRASPERLAEISAVADPVVDYIQQFPATAGMEILLYVIASCFLDINPRPPDTCLTAFDKYVAAARITIEKNLEEAAKQEQEA